MTADYSLPTSGRLVCFSGDAGLLQAKERSLSQKYV